MTTQPMHDNDPRSSVAYPSITIDTVLFAIEMGARGPMKAMRVFGGDGDHFSPVGIAVCKAITELERAKKVRWAEGPRSVLLLPTEAAEPYDDGSAPKWPTDAQGGAQ